MAVHGKYGQSCPVCGSTIQRIRYAHNETNYCPICQTGGRLLADRALSRLLKLVAFYCNYSGLSLFYNSTFWKSSKDGSRNAEVCYTIHYYEEDPGNFFNFSFAKWQKTECSIDVKFTGRLTLQEILDRTICGKKAKCYSPVIASGRLAAAWRYSC